MPKIVRVHGYDGGVTEYAVIESYLVQAVNFVSGFVEVGDGVFLNAQDIKRIEIVEEGE